MAARIQDGALTYAYDANGNRTRMSYPNNVAAVYTHDFANREATLAYEQSGGSQPPAIVSNATYEPFGPLAGLTLGNGLTETRLFDARYFPDGIQVPGRLDLDYTVDAVGNPLQITDLLTPSQSRTYGYLDNQYFLTQGNGPWGTRSWTDDRIGNRLTETRGALIDTYGYTGGNPKLQTVTLPSGTGTKYLFYDVTGNQTQDSRPDNEYQLTYDAAGRLTRLGEVATDTSTRLLYDGRGFLRESRQDLSVCAPLLTQATYTSEGVLVHRAQRNALAPAAAPLDAAYIFYFAGRPVAILKGNVPSTLNRIYLTTDHLGTPVLATSAAGVTVWAGGFEPFGADWSGAQGAGMFLRFPGQWEDASWAGGGLESGLHYNVHRWFGSETSRYTVPDPIGLAGGYNLYLYVDANPLSSTDPTGLQASEWHTPTNEEVAELTQRACARQAFFDNYGDMREANWKLSDKYFHCKANCEAARCGKFGVKEACGLSDMREWFDGLKGDPPSASAADQAANRFGREQAQRRINVSCQIICARYRPKGLPGKY